MSNKKEVNIIGSVTPVIAPQVSKEEKDLAKEKLARFMKEEMRIVKGVFQNFENPGAELRLQVRKYKGHFFDQVLKDGEECDVPLYIARHLNGIDVTAEHINGKLGTCSYEVHSHLMDANGVPILNRANRKKRYGFQSMEFGAAA
jgi:trehalose-6-phosphate synthase